MTAESGGNGSQPITQAEQASTNIDLPIRVAIIDDHTVLVDALRMIVQSQHDMRVVGTGSSCAECVDLLRGGAPSGAWPQVLLLDVILPDGDGINLVNTIKTLSPETNILILSSVSDEATLMRAMQAGVSGFVSKNRNLLEVLRAIREAAAGEIAVPPGLLLGLLNRTSQDRSAVSRGRDTLTQREREILSLLSCGKSGEEIASDLCIAPLTVRTHIRNLLQKLGVRSRLEAVTYALRRGLIEPPA